MKFSIRSLIKSGVRFRFFVIGLTSLIIFTGCGKESTGAIEINNANAVQITVSELPKYKKVIALANGASEIISALGYKSILIGRDIASTEEVLLDIPIVTNGHQVVAENILKFEVEVHQSSRLIATGLITRKFVERVSFMARVAAETMVAEKESNIREEKIASSLRI